MTKFIFAILLISNFATITAQPKKAETKQFNKPLKQLNRGEYKQALSSIRKIKERSGSSLKYYYRRGKYRNNANLYAIEMEAAYALSSESKSKLYNSKYHNARAQLDRIMGKKNQDSQSKKYAYATGSLKYILTKEYENYELEESEKIARQLAVEFKDTTSEYRRLFDPKSQKLDVSIPMSKNYDFSHVDTFAKQPLGFIPKSSSQLAHYLTDSVSFNVFKVRSIFVWIANNIDYDYTLTHSKNAEQTLERRMGVCSDYSDLLIKMCNEVGIESKTVIGDAKGVGYYEKNNDGIYASYVRNGFNSNHAWVKIYVDSIIGWQLMDATWAAVSPNSSNLDYYFMADPMKLIASHYPTYKKDQFLDNPIDYYSFLYNFKKTSHYDYEGVKQIVFKKVKKSNRYNGKLISQITPIYK